MHNVYIYIYIYICVYIYIYMYKYIYIYIGRNEKPNRTCRTEPNRTV